MRRRRGSTVRRAAAVLLCVLVVAIGVPAVTSATAAAPPPAGAVEADVTSMINLSRAQAGLGPLSTDPALVAGARAWSQEMAVAGSLSHDPNLTAEMAAIDPTWQAAAENVGMGFAVASLYQAFLNSPQHYAHIVGNYNRVGVGVVVSGDKIWLTMRFLRGASITPPPPIDPPPAGTDGWFHPLPPARLLDTRAGIGAIGTLPVAPGGAVTLDVTGVGGVPPGGVSAVLLNLTATGATASTHITVHPSGTTRPASSNLNVAKGETVANMVDAWVGSDGKVVLVNNSGFVHLIADVAGYVDEQASGGQQFVGVQPTRSMDTRDGTGTAKAKVGPGGTRSIVAAGATTAPPGATAVVLSVTAVGGTQASHVTVWPTGLAQPTASTLNVVPGRTVPNLAVVPLGTGGQVDLFNNSGSVDLVADVMGWFVPSGGGRHTPTGPSRLRDTRFGPGAVGKVGPGGELVVPIATSVPGADAVVLNVTSLNATQSTHITAYPGGTTAPNASNANLVPGQVKPVLVLVRVGDDGTVRLRNNSGSVDLVVDVFATFADGG